MLSLRLNKLNGTIPTELGTLNNLRLMFLSSNYFTGSIPSELGGMVNLQTLGLYNNSLQSTIPNEICRLNHLEDLLIDCDTVKCPRACRCRSAEYERPLITSLEGVPNYFSCPSSLQQDLFVCNNGYVPLQITIVTDYYPEQTKWALSTNGKIVSVGNATTSVVKNNEISKSEKHKNKNVHDIYRCIPIDGCTTFTIYDYNGICCDFGSGSYTVFVNNTMIGYGGQFVNSETVEVGINCTQL